MSLVVPLATLIACLQIIWVKGQFPFNLNIKASEPTPAVGGGTPAVGGAAPQAPCLFIFGDSLSDSGNNNNLMSLAKCNFLPYGIDFPDGPTGRFTNGRTAIDIIGQHLGLPGFIPSFPSAQDGTIEQGVNYASGSAGILDETGFQVGERVCMNQQLRNHQQIITRIKAKLGDAQGEAQIGKCLYALYAGSNDWMINYYINPSEIMKTVLPTVYSNQLITGYTAQIEQLLTMGAKKVILFGMMPLGCLPCLNLLQTCSPAINAVLQGFNNNLKQLVDKYNQRPGLKFIFINTMDIFGANNLESLVAAGLQTEPACCGVDIECIPLSAPCADRDKHAYWDQAHPTEAANKVFAARAYKAQQPGDSYPMDISSLAAATV